MNAAMERVLFRPHPGWSPIRLYGPGQVVVWAGVAIDEDVWKFSSPLRSILEVRRVMRLLFL